MQINVRDSLGIEVVPARVMISETLKWDLVDLLKPTNRTGGTSTMKSTPAPKEPVKISS